SKRDAHVSQKSATLEPFNRRIPKQVAKLSFSKCQIVAQRKSGCRSARPARTSRGERAFTRNLSEPVPWAGVQTIVATENPIADQRPKVERNRAFQFDRQIRNAAARVQFVRRCDRAGGTS